MNSNTQSNSSDMEFIFAMAGLLAFSYMKYQEQIDQAIHQIIITLLVMLTLGLTSWFAWGKISTWQTRKKRKETPYVRIEEEPPRPKPVPIVRPEPLEVQYAPATQETPKRTVIIDTARLLSRAAHWLDELEPEEQEYLKHHGYELKNFVPFDTNQPEPCLIKKNGIESYEHTYVVNMIAHELEQYTNNIQIHLTQLPDIIFDYNGQEYAVEVETPFGITKKHKRLAQKAQTNNTKYGENWVFVATKSAYAKSFKRYGKVIRRSEIQDWLWDLFPPPPE